MDAGVGRWVKSSFSLPSGDCVEWRFVESGVLVRNSKRPDDPALEFTWREWAAFLAGAKQGEADPPA